MPVIDLVYARSQVVTAKVKGKEVKLVSLVDKCHAHKNNIMLSAFKRALEDKGKRVV